MTQRKKPLAHYNRKYRGVKHNEWTILGGAERRRVGGLGFDAIWVRCRCSCGAEKTRRLSSVLGGETKRCRACRNRLLATGVDRTVFTRIRKDAHKRGDC